MLHRFKPGQMLELRAAPRQSNRPSGICEVVSCLPHDKGPVLYRVRSRSESIERVVDEIDLSPSDAVATPLSEGERLFTVAVSKR